MLPSLAAQLNFIRTDKTSDSQNPETMLDSGDSTAWVQTKLEVERSQNPWFKLALKMHQHYLTTFTHVVMALNMLLSVHWGFLPASVTWIVIGLLAVFDVLVYFAFKFEYNLRFRQPSLIVPRTLFIVGILLYVQIYAGPTKLSCACGIVTVFVFAGTHSKLRTMLRLNLLTILAYAATLPLIRRVEGASFNLHAELLNWICFAGVLPSVVAAGGVISALRENLSNSNTRLSDALQQITELATTDELTKAYNRRYLREMMDYEVTRVLRGGPHFSVLLMDIDFFKRINDTFGHKVGDAVLKAFAQTVSGEKRESDLFARWGGEEFLLFMPQTNLSTARACAERVRRAIQELGVMELPANEHFTVSIGAAEFSEHEKLADLIERADNALYRAKQSGRNRVESAAPLLLATS